MRLVAEIGLVALARETRLGVARMTPPPTSRTPHRAGDDGRVDQRAALDDEAARVKLPVDLSQQPNRKTELVDRLAKPPDRGVVGRLHIQRQAAKAAERQPVAHRLLRPRIGKSVPLLEKND